MITNKRKGSSNAAKKKNYFHSAVKGDPKLNIAFIRVLFVIYKSIKNVIFNYYKERNNDY